MMNSRIMQALTFKRYGKSPDIGLADVPRPTPKADELLVQVHAAGLNPIDNMIPTGMFKPVLHFQLPATLGSDLAGIVTEVGSNVTRFKPGDAVFASLFDLGTGAIAEFAVVPESAAALKPANLSFEQAASIPMVGLTSWQALKERLKLQAGQKVFIPAGSGASVHSQSSWPNTSVQRWAPLPVQATLTWCALWGRTRLWTTRRRISRPCCATTTRCSEP